MGLQAILSAGNVGALIEGPVPQWRSGPKNTRTTLLAQSQHEHLSCADAKSSQEKLIGENNLRPIAFLEQGLKLAAAVALLQVTNKGFATGFMIAAGLFITNNHAIESAEEGGRARVRFNYQTDASGRLAQSEYFACRPDIFFYTNQHLDYTLIAVDGTPGSRYGVVPLGTSRIPVPGEQVCIIQHPMGEPKQIALVDNEVEYVDGQILQYLTDTLPGSSGSPVFNDAWELVALHHSGGWLPEPSSASTHFRNEGIMMSAILADLYTAGLAT